MPNLYDLTLELVDCLSDKTDLVDAGRFMALYKATTPEGKVGYLAYEYAWRRENTVWEDLRCTEDLPVVVDAEFPPQSLEIFSPKQQSTQILPTRRPEWLNCTKRIFGHKRYQGTLFSKPAVKSSHKAVTKKWGDS